MSAVSSRSTLAHTAARVVPATRLRSSSPTTGGLPARPSVATRSLSRKASVARVLKGRFQIGQFDPPNMPAAPWDALSADDVFSGLDFRNGSGTDTLPASHNQSWGVYSSVIFGAELT